MQNQRMLMGSKKAKQKDFKAIMTVGFYRVAIPNGPILIFSGFIDSKDSNIRIGILSPQALDNGKVISQACAVSNSQGGVTSEADTSDASPVTFTIDGIENTPQTMFQYLYANRGKQVPVTFHFD